MTRDEFLKAVTREIGGTFNHEVLDARIKVMDATLKVAGQALQAACGMCDGRGGWENAGRCEYCQRPKDVLNSLTSPARKESR